MKGQGRDRHPAEESLSPLSSLFISSLHIQFVSPEYIVQEEAKKRDYFFLMLLHFDCVTLCVAVGNACVLRCVCVCVCVCMCVCLLRSSPFLSVERKQGRQPAEIEGNDCDLRTKSRAKCFLSLLFSPLFNTFCPRSFIFPLLLHHFLSSALQNRAAKKKTRA